MKLNRKLLAVGLFGLLQATAGAQSTNLNASATESKPQLKPVYPPVEYRLQKPGAEISEKDKIARYGKESSQAWVTIATRRENPTVFHDCSTHEPQLVLLSLGNKTSR